MFGRDARDVPAEGSYAYTGTGPHGVTTGPAVATNTTATHPTNNRGVLGAVKNAVETVKDKTLETTDDIGNRLRRDPGHVEYGRDVPTTYGTTQGAHLHGNTDNYGVGNTTGTHAYSKEHTPTPAATGTFGTGQTYSTGQTYNTGHTLGTGHTYSQEPGVAERRTLGQQTKDAAANVGQKTRDVVDVVAEKMHR